MAKIQYEVTDRPTGVGRKGTIQDQILRTVEKFDKPTITRVGSYTAAMDHRSGRGSRVATYETFKISILFDDDEIDLFDEMLYSLMDYQEAQLEGLDIPKLMATRKFTLIENSWAFSSAGCAGNRVSFSGKFLT